MPPFRALIRAPLAAGLAAFAAALLFPVSAAFAIELGLPADCTVGKDCFVQQFPDMDAGPGTADPFCGAATYDGHDGTDLRILSMADVARGFAVVAMADGTVLRGRDGVPDHLVVTEADRAAVGSKECGNGMVIDNGGGVETQYCHLKQGSIVVRPGEKVKRGQQLGMVGASGMAAFPHVHVTVRVGGKPVDPATGRALSQGCLPAAETAQPLFAPDVAAALGHGDAQLIASGIAGRPVDYATLVVSGPPPMASATSPAIVGWGWFINLRQGDRIVVKLVGPDGGEMAVNRSDPMDHSKASYSAFAGKKGTPAKGEYKVIAGVERNGAMLFENSQNLDLE